MNLVQKNDYVYLERKSKNPNAKTIIFIHGFATTSEYHDGFLKYLNDDYSYYAIQLPGHGVAKLKNKEDLYPKRFANHIVGWIKEMNFKDIYLIGHSMGGGIALMVSSMIPDRFKKVVLVTPMNPSFSWVSLNVFKFVPKDNKKTFAVQEMLLKDAHKFFKDENDPKIAKETKYQLEHRDNFNYLRKRMISFSNRNDIVEAIDKNKLDILMILGKHDRIIYWKSAYKYFKKMPNYRLEVFEESGHLPFWEEPDKYAKTILDFFNEK